MLNYVIFILFLCMSNYHKAKDVKMLALVTIFRAK